MLTDDKVTKIFVMADEFCKVFNQMPYRNQREHMHKVFRGLAAKGKCSLGWFYGFKLHLICNDKGEILNFMITSGDIDDRKPLKIKSFVEFIYRKLVGDKGYISKDLFNKSTYYKILLSAKL